MKLSICVSTYNQVEYIGECLDSILNQIIDVPYEIVISDDFSSDGTRGLVSDYAARYPKIIRDVSPSANGGPFKNYINVHAAATGEFVAHMDGDDVALPDKFTRQINFLQANPRCNVVWHRMIFFDDRIEVVHPQVNYKFLEAAIDRREACVLGPMGPHSSTMYRRENFRATDFSGKCDDWLMALFYMSDGYALMLEGVLGKYRLRENSMSSAATATRANRELSTSSQLMALRYQPKLAPYIATRALANFVLDAMRGRSYCRLSWDILRQCHAFPLFWRAPQIYLYYRWSRKPSIFG